MNGTQTGSCLCGAIRYALTGPIRSAEYPYVDGCRYEPNMTLHQARTKS